jgi:hypothetical protein
VQSRNQGDAVAPPAKGQSQLASQPVLRNVKVEKLNDMFGFTGAKPATDQVAPDAAARKSTPEPAAKPDGAQQAAKREAPAEKPADDAKKMPVQPADALNFARVVLNFQ